jgi:hypothetical protein
MILVVSIFISLSHPMFLQVCNHPDIFERQEVVSPLKFIRFRTSSSVLWESPIQIRIPKFLYTEGAVAGDVYISCCLCVRRDEIDIFFPRHLRLFSLLSPPFLQFRICIVVRHVERLFTHRLWDLK